MLSKNAVVRALTTYADHKDESVRARLLAFGPVLIQAAEIRKTLAADAEEKDATLMAEAMAGKADPVLWRSPVSISRDSLLDAARQIGEALLKSFSDNGYLAEGDADAVAALNWDALVTDELLAKAGSNPTDYLEALEDIVEPAELFDWFVLPVMTLAVRVHLDAVADQMTQSYEPNRNTTVHETRPTTCPVCGGAATLAAVVSTQNQGNSKKLFCSCCGTRWPFERMRCVSCGDMAVSDLHYVHDEGDENHRLHVCDECKDAMPTVFCVDEERLSYDVEVIAMTGLEEAYAAQDN